MYAARSEGQVVDHVQRPGLRVVGDPAARLTGPAQPTRSCPLIRIPDDQLYIMTPLTPLIERRKSININESLIIDNYLTGIRISGVAGPKSRVVMDQAYRTSAIGGSAAFHQTSQVSGWQVINEQQAPYLTVGGLLLVV